MDYGQHEPVDGLSQSYQNLEFLPYSHYRGTQQDASGSRWIPLDASFKDISYQGGIATNVAFDYAGYLARRNTALPNEFYANQVLPTIQAAGVAPYNTNNTLADVPYAGVLNPLTVDVLPASTPYDVSTFLPWAGTTSPETADLPDSHRYKLNVTVNQGTGVQLLTATLSMPQTILGRLTLSYQGATALDQTALTNWQNDGTLISATPTPTPCNVINVVPVLKGLVNGQEGTLIATGAAASPVDLCTANNQLTLSVTLAELVNPTLNSLTYTNINASGYHALQAYGFQTSDRLLTERAALLLANVKANANPNANLDATEGEFLHLVGLKYMRYVADNKKRIAQIAGGSGDSGNHIGLMSSGMKVTYLFDLPFEVARTGFIADWPGLLDRSVDITTGQVVWSTFLLGGYEGSALEYYIWQENTRMDAISTVRGLQFANESGISTLNLTMTSPTSWTTDSANLCTTVNFTPFNKPGKVKDANGNYTLFKYDAKGNLTDEIRLTKSYCTINNCSILNPATYVPAATDMIAWKVNGYDAYGNRIISKQVRDFVGQVASSTATSVTGPIITRTYDASGLYPTTIARTGKKNSDIAATVQTAGLVYDSLGRQTSGIDADWHATQFAYDAADHTIKGSDALGNLRTYQFDANDNPSGERLDIAGSLLDSRSVSYDLDDRKQTSVDAGGNVTAYQYDAAGNVVLVTNPDAYSLSFNYDPSNHEIRRSDAQNHAVTRSVDSEGKPRIITDPNGNAITIAYYDATGNGRLKSITDAGRHQTSLAYDANGNAITVTVAGSDGITTRTTSTFYDELDHPVRIVGPQYSDATLGLIRPVTQYIYDTLGNRTQVLAGYTTDATGANTALDVLKIQTTVAWDDFGRKVKETDPLNQAWIYSYDANNNLVSALDPLLQTTTLTWGYGHQLKSMRDQAGNLTTYTRNALGQVTVAQSPSVSYSYSYDASHRRATANDSRGNKTLSYGYSPGGLLNYMQDNDGNRTDYQYDRVSRLISIWAANYDYVSFSYDAGGRVTERMLSSGVDARYTYNPDNTLASLVNKQGVTTISNHVYSYDVLGNRATQAETVGATTINYAYGYDNLNRLIQVQNGTAAQQENYSYDPLDNRTTKSIGVTTPSITAYVYDNANQLKEIRNGTTTGTLLASLTYDADGNLKGRSDSGLALTYDPLNRLTQTTIGTQTQSYVYDDQGRRIQKTVAGVPTNMLYNGPDLVAEYGATWGLPVAQYTQGPKIDDAIIRATATTAQYFHQDGLGSVVGVTNSAGLTDATQRFDAWGNKLASTGTTPHYGYTGREPDETGLIYYRARYLDPTLGRFTQRDPIGLKGGLNRYGYVGGDPISRYDPFGLSEVVFDRGAGTITISDRNGNVVGTYPAANNTTSTSNGPWQNGTYDYSHYMSHPESGENGPYGSNGNFVFDVPGRSGMGIHSGRDGPESKTLGCIRTTDEATDKLRDLNRTDPLKTITVTDMHGGGGTVGGLPRRIAVPVASYAGNQK